MIWTQTKFTNNCTLSTIEGKVLGKFSLDSVSFCYFRDKGWQYLECHKHFKRNKINTFSLKYFPWNLTWLHNLSIFDYHLIVTFSPWARFWNRITLLGVYYSVTSHKHVVWQSVISGTSPKLKIQLTVSKNIGIPIFGC